jgi:hydroxymethylpyrimidine/phosphomethylpyrimidine kinase
MLGHRNEIAETNTSRHVNAAIRVTIGGMRIALSIAGSDPTGGAGLQADLQVFRALGVHGAGVVTALTVQDSSKVYEVLPVFPNVVLAQLRKLFEDFTPDAIKIGMLASDDVARMVELGLRGLGDSSGARPPIVLDPVLEASDGTRLLERRALAAVQDLVGVTTLVTPNLSEAQALTGCDVSTEEGSQLAASALVMNLGATAALVKGGHRDGPPHDLFAERAGGSVSFTWLEGERIAGEPVHGTGCALASAIAAELAKGAALRDAIETSRRFVARAIGNAERIGKRARFLDYAPDNT